MFIRLHRFHNFMANPLIRFSHTFPLPTFMSESAILKFLYGFRRFFYGGGY